MIQRLALLKPDVPKTMQLRILNGSLSFSQARALLSVKEDLREQVVLGINEKTTVKEIKASAKQPNVTRVTTAQLLKRVDERASQVAGALMELGESISIEEKTYGIGLGCICPRCPRKDECY